MLDWGWRDTTSADEAIQAIIPSEQVNPYQPAAKPKIGQIEKDIFAAELWVQFILEGAWRTPHSFSCRGGGGGFSLSNDIPTVASIESHYSSNTGNGNPIPANMYVSLLGYESFNCCAAASCADCRGDRKKHWRERKRERGRERGWEREREKEREKKKAQ